MGHPFFDLPKPIVIGHRGASGERPENTRVSFECALEQGAMILETDVHLTRDGVVVLSHDPDVARTTESSGPIAELDFTQLRRLDAGHRFSPDAGRSFPLRGQGVRILSLREAFEAFPGIRFNIEIKQDDALLVEGTLAAVADAGREKETLLAAGQDPIMARLRKRLAETAIPVAQGAAPSDVVGFLRAVRDGTEPPPEPMALQVPPSFQGRPVVTRELVDLARRHGVQVHVWTINDPGEMRRLLDLGVDGVMSDFPGRLRDVVAQWRARA